MTRRRPVLARACALALLLACPPAARAALDCTAPVAVVDFGAVSAATVSGNTALGDAQAAVYSCDPGTPYDGLEQVVQVVVDRPGHLFVVQDGGPQELVLFVTSACDEGACIAVGDQLACARDVVPGTYFVVVDSPGPAGPYELRLAFEDAFPSWSTCQGPVLPTQPGDVVSTEWHFTDGAYCVSDPASRNFPNDCTFAMYVNVACGTELQLFFDDVETGDVRVHDVLGGEDVQLIAIHSGGGVQIGPVVSWEDCAATPPDVDDRFTVVSFRDPDALCGVFRIEMTISGWDWDLFANCTADATPGSAIHDSACGALEAWQPFPSLSLANVVPAYSCPDFTVTYDVRNSGCAAASDVEVVLSDDGGVVALDVVPNVPAGSVVTRSIVGTFPFLPHSNVSLALDPGNVIVECDEMVGAGCAIATGPDPVPLPSCGGSCTVVAIADAVPAVACERDVVLFDASASQAAGCPGGVIEYALLVDGGPLPPQWQASPVLAAAAEPATYDVLVRCATAGLPCEDSVRVPLTVEIRPVLDPSSVQAVELGACGTGIAVTWAAATFPSGSGSYSVYRSEISCADALVSAPIGACMPSTSFDDFSTSAGGTYFYVVEAEDGVAAGACAPVVPCVGGAATRVDANGGSCVGITDGSALRPSAVASPDRLCVGSSFTVDASASPPSSCPGGMLQYQVDGPSGVVAPWQDVATFAPIVAEVGAYTIQTRCTLDPSCTGTAPLALLVDSPPIFDPASVVAAFISACGADIRLTWSPATFHGGAVLNHYNIYRSTVSCADALALGVHASVQAPATSFEDFGTTAGVAYFYVVEAEDGDFGTACPAGPRGGAITRVDASGGTCTPVVSVAADVQATATAVPARACAGEPVTVDASDSTTVGCPGDAAEYQLVGPSGATGWQVSDVFAPVVAEAGAYTIEVRCAADPTCMDSAPVALTVDVPGVITAPSFTAADMDACDTGITLTWSAAAFPSGNGTYTLYRSDVSCADALGLPSVASCLTATTWPDTATTAGGTHFYVLEAEDGGAAGACGPGGPCSGGATVQVDANGGTCTGIVDDVSATAPDLLPRVGDSLRLGGPQVGGGPAYGPTFVTLQWTTNLPLDTPAGEHVHVLRSEAPDSGFALLVPEPPRMVAGLFTDTAAVHPSTPHVFHYLVVIANDCEQDNLIFDVLP